MHHRRESGRCQASRCKSWLCNGAFRSMKRRRRRAGTSTRYSITSWCACASGTRMACRGAIGIDGGTASVSSCSACAAVDSSSSRFMVGVPIGPNEWPIPSFRGPCLRRLRLSPAPLSSLPLEVVSIGISTDARICSDSDTEPRAVFLCLAPGLHTLPFRTAPRPAASTLSHSLSHSHDYAGRTASHEHCCPSYIFTYYIPHSIALRPDPRHSLISCFSPAAVHARLVLHLIPAG